MKLDEAELHVRCAEWQEILGLKHWNIDVKVVRGVEINGNCGQNDYSIADENALIRIKTPEDYHGYFEFDMEAVLVHELLHILTDLSVMNKDVYCEQVISRIARALVKLKRRK